MRVKLFAYCYTQQLNMSQMARMIRITSVPKGEAPLWVRARNGLVLSFQPWAQHGHGYIAQSGQLPAQSPVLVCWWLSCVGAVKKTSGYLVSGEAALMALTEVSPEAAAWWRVNAPNFVRPGRYFVFQDGACTPMSEGRGKN